MEYYDSSEYEPVLARRCYAAFIDYLLFFALEVIYLILFGREREGGYYVKLFSFHPFAMMSIWIVYFPGLESILGYTLAKGLFDLRVELDRKVDSPFLASFVRHLFDPIEFFLTLGIMPVILAKTSKGHKRLGDMAARTHVVKEPQHPVVRT